MPSKSEIKEGIIPTGYIFNGWRISDKNGNFSDVGYISDSLHKDIFIEMKLAKTSYSIKWGEPKDGHGYYDEVKKWTLPTKYNYSNTAAITLYTGDTNDYFKSSTNYQFDGLELRYLEADGSVKKDASGNDMDWSSFEGKTLLASMSSDIEIRPTFKIWFWWWSI